MKYELKMELHSDLELETVENMLSEFICENIGTLISGRGEVIKTVEWENKLNQPCSKCNGDIRPRCMFLDTTSNTCRNIGGCCFVN